MDQSYLVILADQGNKHYSRMHERLKEAGAVNQLIDNIFVLTIQNNEELDNMEKVRNYIAGEEFGYCLVIKVGPEFSCAWNIPKSKSELLKEIIEDQKNEKK